MNDLISRQAAIEALEWKWAGKAAIDAIKALPSAHPQQVTGKLNADCISRQAAIDAILAIKDYGNSDRANALGLAERR